MVGTGEQLSEPAERPASRPRRVQREVRRSSAWPGSRLSRGALYRRVQWGKVGIPLCYRQTGISPSKGSRARSPEHDWLGKGLTWQLGLGKKATGISHPGPLPDRRHLRKDRANGSLEELGAVQTKMMARPAASFNAGLGSIRLERYNEA